MANLLQLQQLTVRGTPAQMGAACEVVLVLVVNAQQVEAVLAVVRSHPDCPAGPGSG